MNGPPEFRSKFVPPWYCFRATKNLWHKITIKLEMSSVKDVLPYNNFVMFHLAGKTVPQQMQDLLQVCRELHHQMIETYKSKEFKQAINRNKTGKTKQ